MILQQVVLSLSLDFKPKSFLAVFGDRGDIDKASEEPEVDEMAEKLDHMLLLLFHYLKEVCKEPDEVP